MKFYRLIKSTEGGIFVDKVEGKVTKFCERAYYIKYYNRYVLIDMNSGLPITSSSKLKDLESAFNRVKNYYEKHIKSDYYRKQCRSFDELKEIAERRND